MPGAACTKNYEKRGQPKMKLNYKRTVLVGFAFFLISAFWQAYDTIVPLILTNKFGLDQGPSGIIMSLDNIFAVFLLPIFGNVSDKLRTSYGRRTPFILGGTLVAVAAFSALGFANTLPLFIGLLLVSLLAMATFRSPAVALMPDVTVKPLRSKGNAVINLMGTAGGMIVLILATVFKTSEEGKTDFSLYMITVCGLMVAALVVFLLTVRENKWAAEMEADTEKYHLDTESDERAANGRLSRSQFVSLLFILASVALWYIGYNAVTSKYSVYASNIIDVPYATTLLLANAAAVVTYIPVGMIASKIGRKKSILAGVAILAVAFFGASFIEKGTSEIVMNIFFILAGIGWATINVNSFPMVVELAAAGDVGKYTGFYYTASMAAQVITPIFSGYLMDIFGMREVFFPYATVFVALSFVTMCFVRHGDSKPTAPKSKLEAFADND